MTYLVAISQLMLFHILCWIALFCQGRSTHCPRLISQQVAFMMYDDAETLQRQVFLHREAVSCRLFDSRPRGSYDCTMGSMRSLGHGPDNLAVPWSSLSRRDSVQCFIRRCFRFNPQCGEPMFGFPMLEGHYIVKVRQRMAAPSDIATG